MAAQATTPLDLLIAEALENNPEIAAASKEKEAAEQRVLPAGALDDPMLEAGIANLPVESWSFRREDMTMKMIGLAQKLPYPGKRGLRRDAAEKDADSASFAYQETVNRVVRDVKIAYVDLALVNESVRLVEKNIHVLEQFLAITEAQYTVGQGSEADVLKAQTQLSMMKVELIRLVREREAIEAELSRALGRKSVPFAVVPEPLRLEEVALQPEALREGAFKARPQLLAQESLIARSEKMLALAGKEYYPDLDLRLSFGQRDSMSDGTPREDMVSFTVGINLPVWRASKLGPRVSEVAAMRNEALEMYQAERNELISKLRQEVANAEQNLRTARLSDTGILPQARLAVEASLAAYKVSRVDFFTLLDNQMTVFNSEIAYVSAVAGYNKALAEIDFLTGKPGAQP